MEKIPEKFLNKDGTLNSDTLLRSYSELEKKIGSMVSVPDADSDDEVRTRFNRAIGVPDDSTEYPTNALFDDESVRDKFRDAGLTKAQVEKIYGIAEEFLSPVLSEIFQSQHESNAMTELKSFFGDAEKMKDALSEIKLFGEKFLPADAFESLSASSSGIQSIYKMMQSVEPQVTTATDDVKKFSDDDLRRMMRDPKYWREHDPEYVRKIENGFRKLYS